MSREVHNGPTDDTQARGTPYSGDPDGGEGTQSRNSSTSFRLTMASCARRPNGPVRRL